jgi:colicin import membrane protein
VTDKVASAIWHAQRGLLSTARPLSGMLLRRAATKQPQVRRPVVYTGPRIKKLRDFDREVRAREAEVQRLEAVAREAERLAKEAAEQAEAEAQAEIEAAKAAKTTQGGRGRKGAPPPPTEAERKVAAERRAAEVARTAAAAAEAQQAYYDAVTSQTLEKPPGNTRGREYAAHPQSLTRSPIIQAELERRDLNRWLLEQSGPRTAGAAVTLQAAQRGLLAKRRMRVHRERKAREMDVREARALAKEQSAAAVSIEKYARRRIARKRIGPLKKEAARQKKVNEEISRIQSIIR